MRKGYVFGSSTPREMLHHKAKDKSSVLEALASDAVHDVRPFVKNIHNSNARSKSVPKGTKTFVFGSSTPREWSYHVKIPARYRTYDAKLPPKERSQTVSSLRNLQGDSVTFEDRQHAKPKTEQPATSREARNRHARVNLPPVPHTSRPDAHSKSPPDEDDEDEAASEPDIKMDRGQRKEWTSTANKTSMSPTKSKPNDVVKKQVKVTNVGMKSRKYKQVKEPIVNHVIETDSELIFERSEELEHEIGGKQVIANYDEEEETITSGPLVRAPDTELMALSEDVQLSHPVQVDVAQVAMNNSQNNHVVNERPVENNVEASNANSNDLPTD
ncbi:hypothetical protein M3Y95_00049500 [Aphelenchoides besseyi]|nr:hypothetical protein M3Y95_00049500 [Aphelenchoides besseyi]